MSIESQYMNYGNINESIPVEFDSAYYNKTAGEYYAMYKDYMPTDRNAQILDIGCGKGFFLYYLKQQGYNCFKGIDADPYSIEHTKKHITQHCEYALADQFLSDKQQRYDLVVMNEVLEHTTKEKIIPLLILIRNSLLPKGILICYVPNMENPFTTYTRYHDFTHTIGFTQNSLRMVLKSAGFNNIQVLAPQGTKNGIKKFIKRILQLAVLKILSILFEYPRNGILHSSRIFSVAIK